MSDPARAEAIELAKKIIASRESVDPTDETVEGNAVILARGLLYWYGRCKILRERAAGIPSGKRPEEILPICPHCYSDPLLVSFRSFPLNQPQGAFMEIAFCQSCQATFNVQLKMPDNKITIPVGNALPFKRPGG